MRAETQTLMIDALREFMTLWDTDSSSPFDWDRVRQMAANALAQYEQEIDGATHTKFSGAYYDPAVDQHRLTRQIGRVWEVLSDGQYHTVKGIALSTGDPEPSVSAQVRNLRKADFGGWRIDTMREATGLCSYRMLNWDGTDGPPWRARPPVETEMAGQA